MCEKGILLITPIFIGTETETQRVQVACSKPQKWASLSLTRQPAYLQSLCTFTINKRTKTLNVQWNKRKNSTISHDDMEIFRLRSQIPDDKQFFRFIKDIYIYIKLEWAKQLLTRSFLAFRPSCTLLLNWAGSNINPFDPLDKTQTKSRSPDLFPVSTYLILVLDILPLCTKRQRQMRPWKKQYFALRLRIDFLRYQPRPSQKGYGKIDWGPGLE